MKPGDVNGDEVVNITDVTNLINLIMRDGLPTEGSDVNNDSVVNITDVTVLINMVMTDE